MIALVAWVMFCTPTPPLPPKAPRAFPPTVTYADLELRFQADEVKIVHVRLGRYTQPTAQPRYRGRFVAIVQKGKKSLVEVPLDFPLLAVAENEDATEDAQKLGALFRKHVTATTTVRVPWPEGADSVAVWDSITRKTTAAQPPDPPPSSDGKAAR